MPLTANEKETALKALLRTRSAIGKLKAPTESGVYAIYLRSRGLLAPFAEGENGLIYVGLSTKLCADEARQARQTTV